MRPGIALAVLLLILLSGCAARPPLDVAASPPVARVRFAVFASEPLAASMATTQLGTGEADYQNSLYFRHALAADLDAGSLGMPRAPEFRGVMYHEVAFPAGQPRQFSFDVELQGSPLVQALDTCRVEFSYVFTAGRDYEVDYHNVGSALHRAKCEVIVSELSPSGMTTVARYLPEDQGSWLAPNEWLALAAR